MPKASSSRPALPTSSSDFALPSSPLPSSSSASLDDSSFLFSRFRRPSLLAQKSALFGEGRLHSPLTTSFTLPYTHSRRRSRNTSISLTEDYESDRERMMTDSPISGNNTPPQKAPDSSEEELKPVASSSKIPPLTPPRRRSSASMNGQEGPIVVTNSGRRVPLPLKPARVVNLRSETRPEEAEVKSEAAFQRLIMSCSEVPLQPGTPKTATDRGRYPEEAIHEEPQREDTPSDDDEAYELEEPFSFSTSVGASEPIAIQKSYTSSGSINGDGMGMSISETSSDSNAMEVDMPFGSPSMTSMMSTQSPITHWRYTPPPTSASAIRSNKRKFDDRFDPYPTSTKRRAVSPSLVYLSENQRTPLSRGNGSRIPIPIPISIPGSTVNSAASSPTIAGGYPRLPGSIAGMSSSPTMRSSMGLASPILRPLIRRRTDEEEKEVEGAGEAVNGLTLA